MSAAAAVVEPTGDDKIKIATITWNVGDGKNIGSGNFTRIDDGIKKFITTNSENDIIVICLQEVKYNTTDSKKYIENLSKQFTNYNIIKNMAIDDESSKARQVCTVACKDDFGIFTIILYKNNNIKNFKVHRIDEVEKTDTGGIESIKYDETLSKSISKLMTGGAKDLAYSFENEDFKMVRFIPLFIKKNNKYSILLIGNGHLPFKNPDKKNGKEKLKIAFEELKKEIDEVITFLRENSNGIPISCIISGDYNSRSTYLPFEGSESHIQLIIKAGKDFNGILSAVKDPIKLLKISQLLKDTSKTVKSQKKPILDNTLTEKEKEEKAINELKKLITARNTNLETNLNLFKNIFLTKTGFTEKETDYNALVKNIVKKDVLSNILKESKITFLKESDITFLPSYKFDKDSGNYSLQKKGEIRLCGHADRILYAGDKIKPEDGNKYTCHLDYEGSDHKPISNIFELELIKNEIPEMRKRTTRVLTRRPLREKTNTIKTITTKPQPVGGSRKQTKKLSKKNTYKKKHTKKVK